jgi:hypothetical protein
MAVFLVSAPAYAKKRKTIILRAAGSGALLGLGAGLVSYPFAKSSGIILAGAFVGATLGTVYGFHLANERERAFHDANLEGPEFRIRHSDPTLEGRGATPRFASVPETRVAFPLQFEF